MSVKYSWKDAILKINGETIEPCRGVVVVDDKKSLEIRDKFGDILSNESFTEQIVVELIDKNKKVE